MPTIRLLRHSSTRETAPDTKAEVVVKARKLETVVHCLILSKTARIVAHPIFRRNMFFDAFRIFAIGQIVACGIITRMSTNNILADSFSGNRILFLDGGMGTQLQSKGLQPGETPETWNLTRPDDIRAVHESYLASGADVVYTNTFGANRAKYHGDIPLSDIIESAISIARDAANAAGGERFVALEDGFSSPPAISSSTPHTTPSQSRSPSAQKPAPTLSPSRQSATHTNSRQPCWRQRKIRHFR